MACARIGPCTPTSLTTSNPKQHGGKYDQQGAFGLLRRRHGARGGRREAARCRRQALMCQTSSGGYWWSRHSTSTGKRGSKPLQISLSLSDYSNVIPGPGTVGSLRSGRGCLRRSLPQYRDYGSELAAEGAPAAVGKASPAGACSCWDMSTASRLCPQ